MTPFPPYGPQDAAPTQEALIEEVEIRGMEQDALVLEADFPKPTLRTSFVVVLVHHELFMLN